MQDLDTVQRQIDRQLDLFARMTGGPPDHVDSHHHVHRLFNVARLFLDAGRRYRVPVRGFSEGCSSAGSEGQPEFGKTDAEEVSVEALRGLFRSLVPASPRSPATRAYSRLGRTPSTIGSARPS